MVDRDSSTTETKSFFPFNIGDTYYRACEHMKYVTEPCPACNGARVVTILCGDGSQFECPCEGCASGYQSNGTVSYWTKNTPHAKPFVIASISSMHGDRVWVTDGSSDTSIEFSELFTNEADALAQAEKNVAEGEAQYHMYRANARKRAGKSAWTVRYGKEQIREAERKIAWHMERMREVKPKAAK